MIYSQPLRWRGTAPCTPQLSWLRLLAAVELVHDRELAGQDRRHPHAGALRQDAAVTVLRQVGPSCRRSAAGCRSHGVAAGGTLRQALCGRMPQSRGCGRWDPCAGALRQDAAVTGLRQVGPLGRRSAAGCRSHGVAAGGTLRQALCGRMPQSRFCGRQPDLPDCSRLTTARLTRPQDQRQRSDLLQ